MKLQAVRWLWSSLGTRGIRTALADRAVAYLLLALMTALRLWDPLPVEAVRLRVFDSLQMIWPRDTPARPVVVADIDEASLAALGQWPWPRTRVAELLDKLKTLGAVIVAFDVVFAEPDRLSPASVAKNLPQLGPAGRAALETLPDNDEIFAQAISRSRVVLGETALAIANAGQAAAPARGFATLGPSALPFLPRYPALLPNLATLQAAAAGHGLFTINQEHDGIVRRAPLVLAVGDQLTPSLTLEILRVLTGSDSFLIKTDATGILGLALPKFPFGTDPNGQIWVHFSRRDPNRYVSIKDLMADAVPRQRIAGKIVLVGSSAVGLSDLKSTPTERSMPGVEVHAQVLEAMLSRETLRQPDHALALEVLMALAVGLGLIGLAPLIGPVALLALGAVVAMFLVGLTIYNFRYDHILIDVTYPLYSSLIVYSALVFLNYFREQSGRRRIRRAFSQYMSPTLVEQLAHSPEKLVLGGESRTMTIMFSDVRGFTTISESYKHDPQGLTYLMNRFLTPLTNAILAHKGTIDKYMGDAIMAFWNAPLDDPAQEANACLAALAMVRSLDALNRELAVEAQGGKATRLAVGVGVNTGVCVVGNMGSDLRFDYSVLGDTVNLASRLEGQSKTYGVQILLGEATARAVRGLFPVLEIDLLVVKGKSEPQSVWTLVGEAEKIADPEFVELRELHEDFLRFYREAKFEQAWRQLPRCEVRAPAFGLQPLYALYRQRVAKFLETPPPPEWDGVYVASEK